MEINPAAGAFWVTLIIAAGQISVGHFEEAALFLSAALVAREVSA